MQQKYLAEIRERFSVPLRQFALQPGEIRGLDLLIELGEQLYGPGRVESPALTLKA